LLFANKRGLIEIKWPHILMIGAVYEKNIEIAQSTTTMLKLEVQTVVVCLSQYVFLYYPS
jgi:hypothetical protein